MLIKILMGVFALLLGMVSWFFFTKAPAALSVFVTDKSAEPLHRFLKVNGWLYLFFVSLALVALVWDAAFVTAAVLVVISVYTSVMVWALAVLLKK